MSISLAQGLFMAEAEGMLPPASSSFMEELQQLVTRYNGVLPPHVFTELLEKYQITIKIS